MTTMLMSLSSDMQFIVDLSRSAGKIILEHFGRVERLTKTHQAASSEAVTDADRASQRHIVAALRKRFPGDGIVGEENDAGDDITFDCPNPAGRVWVIDPLDGTNNFVAGFPSFAVCIGLLDHGYPVAGVVYDVCRSIVYAGEKGHGAWMDSRKISALTTPLSDRSVIMLTSNLLDKAGRLPQYPVRWLAQTTWKMRIMGSAALEACQVGAGIAHGALTIAGKIWDAAAAAAVVLEAGGRFTDPAGKDVFPFDLTGYRGAKVPFLAAAPSAQEALLAEIRNYP